MISTDKMYKVTFEHIQCLMPSSGVNLSAAKAVKLAFETKSKIEENAAVIVEKVGGEYGAVIGAALKIQGAVDTFIANLTDIIVEVDRNRRLSGLDPDNFYINARTNKTGPKPADWDGTGIQYPGKGDPRDNHLNLVKGQWATKMPAEAIGFEGGYICAWDWDNSRDDLLWGIALSDEVLGDHEYTIYNAVQDCSYYLKYKVEPHNPDWRS